MAEFYTKSHLQRHIEQHTRATGDIVCPFCKGPFPTRLVLGQHKLNWHGVSIHQQKHGTAETQAVNIKAHNCTLCSKSFKTAGTLKCHMLCHQGTKAFQCLLCLKSFGRKSSLVAHIKTHKRDSDNAM